MARRRVERPYHTARVAAATRLDPDQETAQNLLRRSTEDWQKAAWGYYDTLPEPGFAADWQADSLGRCRLVPAVLDPAGGPPTVIDPDSDADLPEGVTPADAGLVTTQIARLRSPQGGQSAIIAGLALNLFVPGEGYLVGRTDDDFGERWDVFSTDEVTYDGTQAVMRSDPNSSSNTEPLGDDAAVIRVWEPHPRYKVWPNSSMRRCLPICRRLELLGRQTDSTLVSRLASRGLLFLDNALKTATGDPTQSQGDGEGGKDDFVDDFMHAASVAIQDPGSAAAALPLAIFVPHGEVDKVANLVQWTDDLNSEHREQEIQLVRRLATGLSVPTEILTGMGDVNHWGQWFISEDGFRSHLGPSLLLIVQALTTAYLWPALAEVGVTNPERFGVWYDASEITRRPDETDTAVAAHTDFVISDDTRRRITGFTEDDAPDEQEIAQRVAIQQALRSPQVSLTQGGEAPAGPQNVAPAPPDDEGATEEPEAPGSTAAVRANMGERLAQIDRSLLRDLILQSDAAMRRALEQAGGRLRNLTRRSSRAREALDATTDNARVAADLGKALVAQLTDEDPLAGRLDRMGDTFRERVARADDQIIALAIEGGMSESEIDALRQRLSEDGDAAAVVFVGALYTLASDRLYRPEPAPPEAGEFENVLVDPQTIREALTRAGGGPGRQGKQLGLTWSASVEELLRRIGFSVVGYKFSYGDPSTRQTPFSFHRQLDGQRADDIDNPPSIFANTGGVWPYVGYFAPGDHMYCQCDWVRDVQPPAAQPVLG